MRPHSAEERNLLKSRQVHIYGKMEVYDQQGALKSVTNLNGANWFKGADVSFSVDSSIPTGTVRLFREIGVYSLAPMITSSPHNRNQANNFDPLLSVEAFFRVSIAIVARGTAKPDEAAGPTVWRRIIDGKIDDVDWGGRENEIKITFSGQEAVVSATFIEQVLPYGSEAGVAVETVMQSILNDNLGVNSPTIYTPVSPGWFVQSFRVDQGTLYEAVRALALQVGWDFRWRYVHAGDGSHEYRPVFYRPARDPSNANATIGPDEYTDLPSIKQSGRDIRNIIEVEYQDTSFGVLKLVSVSDLASVAEYRRRYMKVTEAFTSNIDTNAEATAFANAMLSDLSKPYVEKSIQTLYPWWPAEIGDVYDFLVNNIHYDLTQRLAVSSISHHLDDGDGYTVLGMRGKPASATSEWLRLGDGTPASAPPLILEYSATLDALGQLDIEVVGNGRTTSFELYTRYLPTDAWTLRGTLAGRSGIFSDVTMLPGTIILYFKIVPIGLSGVTGTPVEAIWEQLPADDIASGHASIDLNPDRSIQLHIWSNDPDTHRAYYEVAIGGPLDSYPVVNLSTPDVVLKTNMPLYLTILSGGLPLIVPEGSVVRLSVLFVQVDNTLGDTIYDQVGVLNTPEGRAEGYAQIEANPDGSIQLLIGSDDTDTVSARYEVVVGAEGDDFPVVDIVNSPVVLEVAMPYYAKVLGVGGLPVIPSRGKVIRLSAVFLNNLDIPGMTVRDSYSTSLPEGGSIELSVTAMPFEGATLGGVLNISILSIDPRAATWSCWARLGAHPTKDGTANAPMGPKYLLLAGSPVDVRSISKPVAFDGDWWIGAVAYDEMGVPGIPFFIMVTVVDGGGGSSDGSIFNTYITRVTGPKHRITFDHNALIEASSAFTINVTTDSPNAGPNVIGQDARWDGTSNTVINKGYADIPILATIVAKNDGEYTEFVYLISLFESGVLIQQATVSKWEWILPT